MSPAEFIQSSAAPPRRVSGHVNPSVCDASCRTSCREILARDSTAGMATNCRSQSAYAASWTIAHLRSMGGGSLWFPASWIIRILQPVWRARCRCRRQADSLELAALFLVRTTCASVSSYSQARRTGLRERTGESRSAGTVPRGGGKNLLDESGCVGVKRVWSR